MSKNNYFDNLQISLASPEIILGWSKRQLPNGDYVGEVTKASTVNYRTLKPEVDGLFCERIFGPVKDWSCSCGRYKKVRRRGITCEKCGVEVIESRIRRRRMGYIKLATPVAHIWYYKGRPNYLALMLDIKVKHIEPLLVLKGASFIQSYLSSIDLRSELKTTSLELGLWLESNILTERQKQRRTRLVKRFKVLQRMQATRIRPEWMILSILPVIPPELRPLVQLDNGRFAASDLNELYRRVIWRNNRLRRFQELLVEEHHLSPVIWQDKRLLQEAVDALLDHTKIDATVKNKQNQPLKSLSDIIKGKQGRFRKNLLGKRVDYSGRSVIVVGPSLRLHQCGLPLEMALELFQPFLIHNLINQGFANNMKAAKNMIISGHKDVVKVLKQVITHHPILLNRAPTLHRLGIQAFEPIIVPGRAIRLHPLVCPAFNADFDGDQMAVHIPLSLEAQTEARLLMMAPHNLLSPATGKPIIGPSQDMVLGCYYLTAENNIKENSITQYYFSNIADALMAYDNGLLTIHNWIWVRMNININIQTTSKVELLETTVDSSGMEIRKYKDRILRTDAEGNIITQYILTTPGRLIFNNTLHEALTKSLVNT